MEIFCQIEDRQVHSQTINRIEELSEFIKIYSTTDYYLNIKYITYYLLKLGKCEPRDYPKIVLNKGTTALRELTLTHLDDLHYFLSQHPSQEYFLEINSNVFRMRKVIIIINPSE
ncbi:hypothetical protein G7B40_025130 [Aetokthonos hydrillicola Thurmond2011]|jgi:hypothetical protein|uniref:Uncharacterized protein n=1 Tax=Aetokthonos hydrillicola Thurmond2011 TaxID=2712845 RepID=A0AAP5IAB0_9CYAN|nr:hypothetical protein [Aetokthonos hydrillicola]MBO3458460.1 hypothetical protein [Aetokthonos hydrillicola CCALA 1050]MBW4586213.1 hypothetical protein [Aetokthonos hydrillicola CCALA 1050]MDR9897821.1 hypothetical protein [Aetokthonos hydrillicola Thurmond2011]